MSWLDKFFGGGYKNIAIAGVLLPQEVTLNFASGATVTDNPAQLRTDVTINVLSAPSGTGFVHVTGGAVDPTARAINLSGGDVTSVLGVSNGGTGLSSAGSNGQVLTVVGGVPAWAAASGFTPGADLLGNSTSTSTSQYVSSLSYSSAPSGGPIAINGTGTSLVIAANNMGFSLSQAMNGSGAGVSLPITAQAAHTGSGAAGGALSLGGGAGDGAGLPGPVVLSNGGVRVWSTLNRTVTANFTFDAAANPDGTVEVDTTSTVVVGTLPAPARGRRYRVIDSKQNFGINKFTLAPFSGEKINGLASNRDFTARAAFVDIESDGTDWYTS